MSGAETVQPSREQRLPVIVARLGGWLFRHRTAVPLPLAALLLVLPAPERLPAGLVLTGAAVIAAGELVRLYAVRHIGAISRTRSDRLGPLIESGPFARVRNPLYIGNVLVWTGFTLCAGFPRLAPLTVVALAVEYHAIVRWEEHLLAARLGEAYRSYAARVPRWIPLARRIQEADAGRSDVFSWRDTLFSERGTLVAIALGFVLLWAKRALSG